MIKYCKTRNYCKNWLDISGVTKFFSSYQVIAFIDNNYYPRQNDSPISGELGVIGFPLHNWKHNKQK